MNLLTPTQPLRDRPWLGCSAGVAAVTFSYVVRLALGSAAEGFPFVIFLPPVVLVTFCCGTPAGLFTAVLAGVIADLTLIAEPGHIVPPWPVGWLALGFYAITVGIDIALIHAMTLAFQRAARAEAGLRRANEQLEIRVGERTAELRRQIVDREAAEAQLRQIQKMETIGQLTGGIAHDFNNMLAVVIGSLEMSRRRLSGDPDRLAASLDAAQEGATRASALVTRLLAFARRQALAPRTVDVNDLVAQMSNLMRRTLGETIEVVVEPADGLWRCFVDAVQLENAILNLAVNARDAMPGGGRMTIATANAELDDAYAHRHAEVVPGRYVAIAVRDAGTGMPADVLERAFDPFFTTKEVGKGTGLGLSQIYGFVRQSGGHVAIASEVDRGTTVTLYLPRQEKPDVADEPEREMAPAAPNARASEMVLVVEDEPGVRLMSIDALRELGYTVLHAQDARHALRLIEDEPQIDLLFTDIVMPSMDGRELASAARRMRPDLKVVYTTGYARIAASGSAADADWLPKPFTLAALATTVRAALDRPASA